MSINVASMKITGVFMTKSLFLILLFLSFNAFSIGHILEPTKITKDNIEELEKTDLGIYRRFFLEGGEGILFKYHADIDSPEFFIDGEFYEDKYEMRKNNFFKYHILLTKLPDEAVPGTSLALMSDALLVSKLRELLKSGHTVLMTMNYLFMASVIDEEELLLKALIREKLIEKTKAILMVTPSMVLSVYEHESRHVFQIKSEKYNKNLKEKISNLFSDLKDLEKKEIKKCIYETDAYRTEINFMYDNPRDRELFYDNFMMTLKDVDGGQYRSYRKNQGCEFINIHCKFTFDLLKNDTDRRGQLINLFMENWPFLTDPSMTERGCQKAI